MHSAFDPKLSANRLAEQEASSVDPVERSKEAWATAFAEAVFHKLPLLDLPSANAVATSAEPDPKGQATSGNLQVDRSASLKGNASTSRSGELSQLSTEIQVERLGKVAVQVTRGPQGLNIVIVVADSHVKSLLESEVQVLLSNLRNAGLGVNSVRIDKEAHAGTSLALDRDRLKGTSFQRPTQNRLKAYRGLEQEDESEANEESIRLTV